MTKLNCILSITSIFGAQLIGSSQGAMLRATPSLVQNQRSKNTVPFNHKSLRMLQNAVAGEGEGTCNDITTSFQSKIDMILGRVEAAVTSQTANTEMDNYCDYLVAFSQQAMSDPEAFFMNHYDNDSQDAECAIEYFLEKIEEAQTLLPDGFMHDPTVCQNMLSGELKTALEGVENHGHQDDGRRLEIFTIVVVSLVIGLGVVIIPSTFIILGACSAIDCPTGEGQPFGAAPLPEEGLPLTPIPAAIFDEQIDFASGDEFYIINPRVRDFVLEVNGECRRGANVQVGRQAGSARQRFRLGQDSSIESVHCPGLVLDVSGGIECDEGANIHLWDYPRGANQQWGMDETNGYISPQYTCWEDELPTIGASETQGLRTGSNIELQRYRKEDGNNLEQGWTFAKAPNEDKCVRGFDVYGCDVVAPQLMGLDVQEGQTVDFELLQGNFGTIVAIISRGSPENFNDIFEEGFSIGVGDQLGDQGADPALSKSISFTATGDDFYSAWLFNSDACRDNGHEFFVSWRMCIRVK